MRRVYTIIVSVVIIGLVGTAVYFSLPSIFGSVVAPLPDNYKGYITDAGHKTGVDSCLIAAVIRGESTWDPNARSRAGAVGLMQLLPGTAQAISSRYKVTYTYNLLYDPQHNILYGSWLLAYNLDSYGSVRNALVAYNAGGSRVGLSNSQLPAETRAYVVNIINYYGLYRSLYPGFCTGMTNPGHSTSATSQTSTFTAPSPTPVPTIDLPTFWKSFLATTP